MSVGIQQQRMEASLLQVSVPRERGLGVGLRERCLVVTVLVNIDHKPLASASRRNGMHPDQRTLVVAAEVLFDDRRGQHAGLSKVFRRCGIVVALAGLAAAQGQLPAVVRIWGCKSPKRKHLCCSCLAVIVPAHPGLYYHLGLFPLCGIASRVSHFQCASFRYSTSWRAR